MRPLTLRLGKLCSALQRLRQSHSVLSVTLAHTIICHMIEFVQGEAKAELSRPAVFLEQNSSKHWLNVLDLSLLQSSSQPRKYDRL